MKDLSLAQIHTSHPSFLRLIEESMNRGGISLCRDFRPGIAKLVLDFPQTWAFGFLERLTSFERSHTVICTQSQHAAYRDCLASYHVSSVVPSTDDMAILAGVISASAANRSYQYSSGLTYMELRVTRELLLGHDTKKLAKVLSISHKTVNAHVSNILCKLGYDSRAQYIAILLGGSGVKNTDE